ncbi:hypothetical protein HN51_065857 [Arachis hypogaea]|uniref:uncharacterized protein LOC107639178 n=1 Tax=Arachis ipaensis TaxID=130454 RepID=UPI0007AF6AF6|nr:uncharacterized protein LOC107639178 [Arachis ipaensis]XP_025646841.1 uncharacterized protein LOC112741889 [Arachis hypogaea]QHO07105.1 uncharacterized protein DS421_14g460660 [Arachis hypogaea]
MGGCFSSRSCSKLSSVRLVHLSGYVEDFEEPISVSQVIGNPPKHFVCTSIQLLSSSSKPLKGDTQLQPGHVYFILPYSILQSEASPVDLASLAKRLNSIAKTRCEEKKNYNKKNKNKKMKNNTLNGKTGTTNSTSEFSSSDGEFSSVWSMSSPCRSPARIGVAEQVAMAMAYGGRSPCRWKPILDTIREKSFNRRSESELLNEAKADD